MWKILIIALHSLKDYCTYSIVVFLKDAAFPVLVFKIIAHFLLLNQNNVFIAFFIFKKKKLSIMKTG